MKVIFDAARIDSDLPGIVLLSHGPLALACVESVEMLMGEQPNLAAFGLETFDTAEEYASAVLEAVRAFPEGSVVIVDLYGGTPCNQMVLAQLKGEAQLNLISAISLPMVLEACTLRTEAKGEELLAQIGESAKAGIINITETLAQAT